MSVLKPSIEFLMLSKLQKYWGGSHDVILGMLLWLHDMPTIPLHSVMHFCPISRMTLVNGTLKNGSDCDEMLIYHKVRV